MICYFSPFTICFFIRANKLNQKILLKLSLKQRLFCSLKIIYVEENLSPINEIKTENVSSESRMRSVNDREIFSSRRIKVKYSNLELIGC